MNIAGVPGSSPAWPKRSSGSATGAAQRRATLLGLVHFLPSASTRLAQQSLGGRTMRGIGPHTIAAAEPSESCNGEWCLTVLEQALLEALDGDFVSTTVVRDRAHLKTRETSPIVSRKMLSRNLPLAPILFALHELERRGWAQRRAINGCTRWRRAPETGEAQPAD